MKKQMLYYNNNFVNPKKAVVIVAIMRKLAVLAFNLYTKGQVYDIRKFG